MWNDAEKNEAFITAFSTLRENYACSPLRLHQAIAYVLESEGKYIRPELALLVNDALGGETQRILKAACAIELMHTYSLVHDDLPCMDDDPMRRNRPSLHIAFDYAHALLAGDALQADAFVLISEDESLSSAQKSMMVLELARACGSQGMVYGQSLDLYWTGRSHFDFETLKEIHLNKTARLFEASALLGALSVTLDPPTLAAMREVGTYLGFMFQIQDDLNDDRAQGKSKGKDQKQNKLTILRVETRDQAVARLNQLGDLTREVLYKQKLKKGAFSAFERKIEAIKQAVY